MLRHPLLKTLQYLILGLCVAMTVVISQGWLHLALSQSLQEQAEALTHTGRDQLEQGQAEAALQSWQQATGFYRQLNAEEEVAGTLLNQSLALKSMGQLPRACTVLLDSLQLDHGWLCDPFINSTPSNPLQALKQALEGSAATPITLSGLQELGTVLRRLGELEESELVLRQALNLSHRLPGNPETGKVWLRLGDTQQTFYAQAQERYAVLGEPRLQERALTTAQTRAQSALDAYEESIATSPQAVTLQARLNALSLLLNIQAWAAKFQSSEPMLATLQSQTENQIQPLLDELLQSNSTFTQLPPDESVSARLNFALSLDQLQKRTKAIEYAQAALQSAQKINHARLISYSLGILGRLSADTNQARTYLSQALSLTSHTQAPDMAYQWQEELGRLSQASGNQADATLYFRNAVSSLEQVRDQLLSRDSDFQFSFKEKVEPIYQQYMRLLFGSKNPNYKEILQVNEQLRLAELENYLKCGRLNLVSPTTLKGPRPAFIYVLNLGDRFEEIVLSPDGMLHHHTPNSQILNQTINLFQTYLEGKTLASTPEAVYLPYAQALYDQLIAPIKPFLPQSGTLVFSLDTTLQTIPMDLLFDGESYLFERYSTALTLGSQIQPPQALEWQNQKALLAGISQASPSFQSPQAPEGLDALPSVQTELDAIGKVATSNQALLNEAFTYQQFQDMVNTNSFPIVHVATHGQFSSDPQQTLILAWDRPITVAEFNTLLKSQQGNRLTLELLTLSACETAQGDKRSALGLAGVAVQAGARSTLASLWRVEEAATSTLMDEFYKNLKAGLPKAEAKRQAQLTLRRNPQTANPYQWAPFVLIGNWL